MQGGKYIIICPLYEHPIIGISNNELKKAAVSVKRTITKVDKTTLPLTPGVGYLRCHKVCSLSHEALLYLRPWKKKVPKFRQLLARFGQEAPKLYGKNRKQNKKQTSLPNNHLLPWRFAENRWNFVQYFCWHDVIVGQGCRVQLVSGGFTYLTIKSAMSSFHLRVERLLVLHHLRYTIG